MVQQESDQPRSLTEQSEFATRTIQIEWQRLRQSIAQQLAQRGDNPSQLENQAQGQLPLLALHPYGLTHHPDHFRCLPEAAASRRDVCWFIELQALGPRMASLGIELVGDVVLGIGRSGSPAPDLDLSPFGADEKRGVTAPCAAAPQSEPPLSD